MDSQITLPLWLVVVLILFTVFLFFERVLIPSVRWYLRRRVNRVIADINSHLHIEIRPFQRTRRQILIDQLVFDEKVTAAVKEYANDKNMPLEVAQNIARKYAKEIIPSFNAYMYFRVGYALARNFARLIYRIRVGFFDHQGIEKIDPESTVVFVMNHRSNMDYILVSFLAAERTALSYAVGEWAKVWPLHSLIKAMGAFFVRRNSGNPLYRRVLERYVHMATRAGVCQAVFPEGGLTRDGATREPRLGFIDYMLRDYNPSSDRDIVFVPVGINYDRVIEDRTLLRKLDKSAEKRSLGYVLKTSLSFLSKNVLLTRRNRWRRFGYASVNFGQPFSVKHYLSQQQFHLTELDQDARFLEVAKLADQLMDRIQHVIPVLPVALICRTLIRHREQWLSLIEIKQFAAEEIEHLRQQKAPITLSENAYDGVLNSGFNLIKGRKLLEESNGRYKMKSESIDIINYYANSIGFWN
jgi:glycerol-3-phosphate O-acyltransferase